MNEQAILTDEDLDAAPIPAVRGGLISANELCEITGVTYRQLDYWVRLGVVRPALPANGSGSQRKFSGPQVPVMRCLGQLAAVGAGADQLRAAFNALSGMTHREWEGRLYVSPGAHVSRKMMGPVALALNLDKTRGDFLAWNCAAVA